MDTLPDESRRILIGRIVKVRGLRGDLKIVPFTWLPDRFQFLESVLVLLPDGEIKPLTLTRTRVENSMIFVRFKEAGHRDLAEELIGGEIYIDINERAPLPEDMYYLDDLEGCGVTCSIHGDLGKIVEVLDLPANDVWRVVGRFGEVLIPVIKQVVDKILVEERIVHVTLLEGLIDQEKIDEVLGNESE